MNYAMLSFSTPTVLNLSLICASHHDRKMEMEDALSSEPPIPCLESLPYPASQVSVHFNAKR